MNDEDLWYLKYFLSIALWVILEKKCMWTFHSIMGYVVKKINASFIVSSVFSDVYITLWVNFEKKTLQLMVVSETGMETWHNWKSHILSIQYTLHFLCRIWNNYVNLKLISEIQWHIWLGSSYSIYMAWFTH